MGPTKYLRCSHANKDKIHFTVGIYIIKNSAAAGLGLFCAGLFTDSENLFIRLLPKNGVKTKIDSKITLSNVGILVT